MLLATFSPLKNWVEQSNSNWNVLIVGGVVLIFIALSIVLTFRFKIGKVDERTNEIYLKSSYLLLCVVVLCDLIFPKEYMWQIFFLFKYSLAILVSGIYLAIRYMKDFSN
ncbi:hypothetical protein [Pontibacillus litoralis]|nr:hypothetical protein [Pontibacillus litoralis]